MQHARRAALVAAIALALGAVVAHGESPPEDPAASAPVAPAADTDSTKGESLEARIERTEQALAELRSRWDETFAPTTADTVERIVNGEFRAFNTMLTILAVFVTTLGLVAFWVLRGRLERELEEGASEVRAEIKRAREDFARVRIRSHLSLQHQIALRLWKNCGELDEDSPIFQEAVIIALSIAQSNFDLAIERFDAVRNRRDDLDTLCFLEAHNSYAYYRSLYHYLATTTAPFAPLSHEERRQVIAIALGPYMQARRNASLDPKRRNDWVFRQRFNWTETYAEVLIRLGDAAEQSQGRALILELRADPDLPEGVKDWIDRKYRDLVGPLERPPTQPPGTSDPAADAGDDPPSDADPPEGGSG